MSYDNDKGELSVMCVVVHTSVLLKSWSQVPHLEGKEILFLLAYMYFNNDFYPLKSEIALLKSAQES